MIGLLQIMKSILKISVLSFLSLFTHQPWALAEDPPNQQNKPIAKFQYKSDGIEVPAATADEPKIKSFGPESILAAQKYLDDGANYWVRERSCVACHSTGVYMAERPALTALLGKPSTEVLDEFVSLLDRHTVELGENEQVLPNEQIGWQVGVGGGKIDLLEDADAVFPEIEPEHADRAGCRRGKPEKQVHGRGFQIERAHV